MSRGSIRNILVGSVLIIGIAWLFYGWLMNDVIFINIVNACPRMIRDALVLSTVVALVVFVDRARRNSSMGGLILGLGTSVPVLLLLPVIGLTILGGENGFLRSSSYCPNCNAPVEIRDAREEGSLAAAEERALKFFRDELKRTEGGNVIIASQSCVADGEVEYAKVLLDKSGGVATNIESMQLVPEDKESYSKCDAAVAEANGYLSKALEYAEKDKEKNSDAAALIATIKERQKTLELLAAKCVPPKPNDSVTFEYNGQKIKEGVASVRVKVFTEGKQQAGLASLLEIRQYDNAVIPAEVSEVNASEAVCMLFVADNSGSLIIPSQNPLGLTPVKDAVNTLNEALKENDYRGMVTFGTSVDTRTAQLIGFDALNPDLITGKSGNTAIWDALDYGIQTMSDDCKPQKKYLILMTDGVDTASKYLENVKYEAADGDTPKQKKLKQLEATVAEMRTRAQSAGIDIFVIAVGAGSKDEDQQNAFKALVDEQRYYEVAFAGLAQQLKDIFGYQEDHYLVKFGADYLGTEQKIKVGIKAGSTEVVIDFSKP